MSRLTSPTLGMFLMVVATMIFLVLGRLGHELQQRDDVVARMCPPKDGNFNDTETS
jgi:hypothetical protein